MKHNEIIDTLNDLIKICHDGAEGFRACAENANIDAPKLKSLLIDRSHTCAQSAEELTKLVQEQGGTAATGTTASGVLHRGWLNVKTSITGKSDRVVLEECERGEDVAKQAYLKALDKDLPAPIRMAVERQYQGVLHNHDLIKKLRDEARTAQP